MAASESEMTSLMQEYEAIRAHLKLLTSALSSIDTGANVETAQSTQVKDQMWHYRQGLWDFQETIRRHSELEKTQGY